MLKLSLKNSLLFPLTFAGSAFLALGVYFVFIIGFGESDLFALGVGGGFLILMTICLAGTSSLFLLNRRQLGISFQLNSPTPLAQRVLDLSVTVTDATLFPLYQLRIEPLFSGPDGQEAFSPFVQVIRGTSSTTNLQSSLQFPHRGVWLLSSIHVSIQDRFGLTALNWRIAPTETFSIHCEVIQLQSLPVVAASARSGDDLQHTRERSGDLFDTKTYDPSDGIKRILWKTFARSGELIVRRPEPAVIPEGEVPLYLCAGPGDDVVVGALLGYVSQLERMNVQVLFGMDGLGKAEILPGEAIREHTTSLAWDLRAGSGSDFERYLQQLEANRRFVSQVVVFGPAVGGAWLERLFQAAGRRQLKLAIAFVPAQLASMRIGAVETPEERKDFIAALQLAERGGALPLVCHRAE